MSWPTDGRPRYVVASCSGYRSIGHGGHRPGQSWLVLDRARNHHTIIEIQHEQIVKNGRNSRERGIERARRLAHELCETLNREFRESAGIATSDSAE